jgi:NAD(P)-dependent dehydrogenase (short-subunit alcohol dehydrogenase family)
MSRSRIVVITGVTSGLGRALVDGFAREGHTILGCGRAKDRIDLLNREFGAPHRFSVVDVSSDSAVRTWAQASLEQFGPPDLLINNAGVINANQRLWEVPAAEFERVIAVNLTGTANVIRHFVPAMVRRKHGVIVNFSSGWGRSTDAQVAPYCASKWGIEGLTQALAQELPKGMAAIPLNPGIINTEMLRTCFGASAASYPDARRWAEAAVPFILKLGPSDNGKPLEVPLKG